MISIKLNEATAARRRVYFDLRQTDGLSPALGEAGGQPEVSINGSAWTVGTLIGVLVAIGQGRYYADLTTDGVSTLGRIETRYKSANTLESPGDSAQVVAFDPYDAAALGLTDLAAAKATADNLDTAMELDGAVYRFTTNALEQAPVGSNSFTATDRETLDAILARINSVQVVTVSGVDPDGNYTIYKTFDYDSDTQQQIQITVSGLPTLDGTPVLEYADGTDFVSGTQTSLGSGQYRFDFNVSAANTASLVVGDSYVMRVRCFVGAKARLAAELNMNVR